MLKGKKIVVGITGSIAAYKIPFLIRLLVREGAVVKVIMTPAACDFVTPLTLSTLSLNPVIIRPFSDHTGEWNNHVELGLWADLMLFAPVTANTLAKMASGLADNFLVTAYLSAKCPVMIAPAMDLDMFLHPTTLGNLDKLRSFGNIIIEPQTGELASGLSGPGRMEEPEKILSLIGSFFQKKEQLKGKNVLVTAGPTRENIDPVRFISNHSSGLMGYSLAEEAASRGAAVTLISGPTGMEVRHPSVKTISVLSSSEMLKECRSQFPSSDITVMAAAVADYTVKKPAEGKIKKTGRSRVLELDPATDILGELGKTKKRKQFLAGFALETDNEVGNAKKKMKSKNLDLIVLNSLKDKGAGFGYTTNKVTIITRNGKLIRGFLKDKKEVAADIWDVICQMI